MGEKVSQTSVLLSERNWQQCGLKVNWWGPRFCLLEAQEGKVFRQVLCVDLDFQCPWRQQVPREKYFCKVQGYGQIKPTWCTVEPLLFLPLYANGKEPRKNKEKSPNFQNVIRGGKPKAIFCMAKALCVDSPCPPSP